MNAVLALTAALAPTPVVAAQQPCALDLVGAWDLVSVATLTREGRVSGEPFGRRPSGMFVFTADGHTSVIISYEGRDRLSSDDRLAGSVAEKAKAFDTSFSYAGRYSCSGDRVVVRVTSASVQNWVGTDMVRFIKMKDGRLSVTTPPFVVGGVESGWELVWERAK